MPRPSEKVREQLLAAILKPNDVLCCVCKTQIDQIKQKMDQGKLDEAIKELQARLNAFCELIKTKNCQEKSDKLIKHIRKSVDFIQKNDSQTVCASLNLCLPHSAPSC